MPQRVFLPLLLLSTWSIAGWTASASAPVARPASQVLTAREARVATTSQVLAFNVSSFVLLMFIKAMMVTLGVITGFSGLGLLVGRSLEQRSSRAASDVTRLRWMEDQVAAVATGNIMCVYHYACEEPLRAKILASGADIVIAVLKMTPISLPQGPFYEKMIASIRLAANVGEQTPQLCKLKFPCKERPIMYNRHSRVI
ncbi:uncharacterized protein LOC135398686 [Ornithodoros turicata]|uniref:uncharacterized protein LOC135398686 n=1 Tax=Ornithodoros turicata TaxID=34597 RepID=UPI0031395412